MKKLKYLLFLFTFLLITDVNAADTWTGTNWAANSPTRIEVFGYRNENGSVTYPYSSYQPVTVSAFNFNGFRANGWNGYSFNQTTGTGYSLTQYTNSFNLIYNNYSFTSGGDYVTLKGQIMPSNQVGIDILRNLSWYITANYGSSNVSDCVTNTGEVDNMYFANFECSFPRTNSLVISLHFNNYTTYNQGAQFMIRNDYSDVMYSNDNTSIITGSIGGASQGIINNQNQNTQDIINNNSGNTQNIIDNQNQNKQDIINNQNQNTQQQIESQKVCQNIDKINGNENGYLDGSGKVISNSSTTTTDFIKINQHDTIEVVLQANSLNYCFYNANKTYISCYNLNNTNVGDFLTIPTNASYIRFTINKSSNRPTYRICQNGNQALNDSVTDLNDNITSDTPPDTENQISNLESDLISDTPISDLITLPIILINSYISGFNGSCTPYNFGNLLGTDIIFPCINLEQRLGSNLWHIIDSLFSIYMIYNIAMLMIQAFEGFTSLRDDYEGLYQPRHADLGYQPKHGGGE